jgi:hypothetical protein
MLLLWQIYIYFINIYIYDTDIHARIPSYIRINNNKIINNKKRLAGAAVCCGADAARAARRVILLLARATMWCVRA